VFTCLAWTGLIHSLHAARICLTISGVFFVRSTAAWSQFSAPSQILSSAWSLPVDPQLLQLSAGSSQSICSALWFSHPRVLLCRSGAQLRPAFISRSAQLQECSILFSAHRYSCPQTFFTQEFHSQWHSAGGLCILPAHALAAKSKPSRSFLR
jgi:hypothetical protein